MARSGQRAVRLAVILPPLIFMAVFGYWRFLGSDAFRVLLERLIGRVLSAEVAIGSHKVESPARIVLQDLSVNFKSDGKPGGVAFRAKTAHARARSLLGIGALEEMELSDAEASIADAPSVVTGLDFLKRPAGRSGVKTLRLKGLTLSFLRGGRPLRVPSTDWQVDFTGTAMAMSVRIAELRIEGINSAALEEEKPEVAFNLEVDGPRVRLRDLSASGRSGWGLAGTVMADLAADPLHLEGKLHLWDLPLSRVYTPKQEVEISSRAHVEQRIDFAGPADNVRFEVTSDLKGVTYADRKLGLEAKGVTATVKKVAHHNLVELAQRLARGETAATEEADDAGRDVQD